MLQNVFWQYIASRKKIFQRGEEKYNAITILDASQTGGVLDFKEISNLSDFIVFAGHKNLYGPSGIGWVYIQ